MLALLLTILCSVSIALILKYNDTRKGQALILLAGNYLTAAIISLLFLIKNDGAFSFQTLLFGMFLGLLFLFSFFAFTQAVATVGAALATLSARLSVIVPVILSILLYRENPDNLQLVGFLLTLLTVLFFYLSVRSDKLTHWKLRDYFYVAVLLPAIGVNDFSMKLFQQWRPPSEKPLFLLSVFGSAFIYSCVVIWKQRPPIEPGSAIRGLLLGIPNMFSSYFLIAALVSLPAIIVYPVTNLGIIVLTTAAVALFWKERLNRYAISAIISGSAAIMLISQNLS